jgi:hypothetical protein
MTEESIAKTGNPRMPKERTVQQWIRPTTSLLSTYAASLRKFRRFSTIVHYPCPTAFPWDTLSNNPVKQKKSTVRVDKFLSTCGHDIETSPVVKRLGYACLLRSCN